MALEGSLRDMSLVDLIRFLRMRSRSGVLVLTAGAQRGTIYVSVGHIIDAALAHGPERQAGASAEEAVLRMLQWEEGSFSFQHDPGITGRAVHISDDGEWLIEEARRRHSNPVRALPPGPITLDTRIELAELPASAARGINLDLDQWRILSQVAVSHDVRTICEVMGLAVEQVISILADLAALGLIDISTPPDAVLPELGGPSNGPQAPEQTNRQTSDRLPVYDRLVGLLRRIR